MSSLNEMFGCDSKRFSTPGMSTYSSHEAGGLDLTYKLELTVYSAKVENLSSKAKRKLVSHMTERLGYETCNIDNRNNTIYVYSINAVDSGRILSYVKTRIDSAAIVTG